MPIVEGTEAPTQPTPPPPEPDAQEEARRTPRTSQPTIERPPETGFQQDAGLPAPPEPLPPEVEEPPEPEEPTSVQESGGTYFVRHGDSRASIADRVYSDPALYIALIRYLPQGILQPGQELDLPSEEELRNFAENDPYLAAQLKTTLAKGLPPSLQQPPPVSTLDSVMAAVAELSEARSIWQLNTPPGPQPPTRTFADFDQEQQLAFGAINPALYQDIVDYNTYLNTARAPHPGLYPDYAYNPTPSTTPVAFIAGALLKDPQALQQVGKFVADNLTRAGTFAEGVTGVETQHILDAMLAGGAQSLKVLAMTNPALRAFTDPETRQLSKFQPVNNALNLVDQWVDTWTEARSTVGDWVSAQIPALAPMIHKTEEITRENEVLNYLATMPPALVGLTWYGPQIANHISKIPERIAFMATLYNPQPGVTVGPAQAEALRRNPELAGSLMLMPNTARADFELAIKKDPNEELTLDNIDWNRAIGGLSHKADFSVEGFTEAFDFNTGVTGLGVTFMYHPERFEPFIESITREDEPLTFREAQYLYEDVFAEAIVNAVTDPLNFTPVGVQKLLFPASFILEPGIDVATKTLIAPLRIQAGRATGKVLSSMADAAWGPDWLLQYSRSSMHKFAVDATNDALNQAARHFDELGSDIVGDAHQFWQRILLGDDQLMRDIGLGKRAMAQLNDLARVLKEAGLENIKDLIDMPRIRRTGVWNQVIREAMELVDDPAGDIGKKALQAALDRYLKDDVNALKKLFMSAYDWHVGKELGIVRRPRGKITRIFHTAGQFLREAWLAGSVRFNIANMTSNYANALVQGYMINPFDVGAYPRIAAQFESMAMTGLPNEVVKTFVLDALEPTGGRLAAEMIPGVGKPSIWLKELGLITADQSKKMAQNPIIKLLDTINISNVMKKSLDFSSDVERTARAQVFWQAYQEAWFGSHLPEIVANVSSDPNAPRAVVDALANGRIQNVADIRAFRNALVSSNGDMPSVVLSSLAPETVDPNVFELHQLRTHLDELQAKFAGNYDNPRFKEEVADAFRLAEETMGREYNELISALRQLDTPQAEFMNDINRLLGLTPEAPRYPWYVPYDEAKSRTTIAVQPRETGLFNPIKGQFEVVDPAEAVEAHGGVMRATVNTKSDELLMATDFHPMGEAAHKANRLDDFVDLSFTQLGERGVVGIELHNDLNDVDVQTLARQLTDRGFSRNSELTLADGQSFTLGDALNMGARAPSAPGAQTPTLDIKVRDSLDGDEIEPARQLTFREAVESSDDLGEFRGIYDPDAGQIKYSFGQHEPGDGPHFSVLPLTEDGEMVIRTQGDEATARTMAQQMIEDGADPNTPILIGESGTQRLDEMVESTLGEFAGRRQTPTAMVLDSAGVEIGEENIAEALSRDPQVTSIEDLTPEEAYRVLEERWGKSVDEINDRLRQMSPGTDPNENQLGLRAIQNAKFELEHSPERLRGTWSPSEGWTFTRGGHIARDDVGAYITQVGPNRISVDGGVEEADVERALRSLVDEFGVDPQTVVERPDAADTLLRDYLGEAAEQLPTRPRDLIERPGRPEVQRRVQRLVDEGMSRADAEAAVADELGQFAGLREAPEGARARLADVGLEDPRVGRQVKPGKEITLPSGDKVSVGRSPDSPVDNIIAGSQPFRAEDLHTPIPEDADRTIRGILMREEDGSYQWHWAHSTLDETLHHGNIAESLGRVKDDVLAVYTNQRGRISFHEEGKSREFVFGTLVAAGFDPEATARMSWQASTFEETSLMDILGPYADSVEFKEQAGLIGATEEAVSASETLFEPLTPEQIDHFGIKVVDPESKTMGRQWMFAQTRGEKVLGAFDPNTGRFAWGIETGDLVDHGPVWRSLGLKRQEGVQIVVTTDRIMVGARDVDELFDIAKVMRTRGVPPNSTIVATAADWDGGLFVGSIQELVTGRVQPGAPTVAELMQYEEDLAVFYANLRQEAWDTFQKAQRELRGWRQTAYSHMDDGIREWTLIQQEIDELDAWFGVFEQDWASRVEDASYEAANETHRILFDYASRNNAENILRNYSPFTTWQLRNPMFWAQTFAERPTLLGHTMKAWRAMEIDRKRRNLTQRFKGTVGAELPGGGYLATDVRFAVPVFSQLQEPFEPIGYEEPEALWQRAMKDAIDAGSWIGIRPWPWIEYGLQRMGVMPERDLTRGLFGPFHRLAENFAVQQGWIEPWESLLGGEDPGTRGLYEYYIQRRLTELEAEGEITHEEWQAAIDNPEHPAYQRAKEEVISLQSVFGYASLVAPTPLKFATEGELTIREDQALQEQVSDFDRLEFREERPHLQDYGRLFMSEEERQASIEREQLFDRLNDRELTFEERDEIFNRIEEITQGNRFPIGTRPTMTLLKLMESEHPVESEEQVYRRLNALEPRPSDFEDENGDIDWRRYEQSLNEFEQLVPQLSRTWGFEMDLMRFEQWENRLRDPLTVAMDLNRQRRNEGWRQLEAYQPGGENFYQAATEYLNAQMLDDIIAGMEPAVAYNRMLDEWEYIQANGLPFDIEQELLGQYIREVPAEEFAAQVAERLAVGDRLAFTKIREQLAEAGELPGMFTVADRVDEAQNGLKEYYFDLTPNEQRQVVRSLEVPADMSFNEWVESLRDETVTEIWDRVWNAAPGSQQELETNERIALQMRLRHGGMNEYLLLPINDELTVQERLELDQVERDWYQYTHDQEVRDRPGTWTDLMEKYYGEPQSHKSQFWQTLDSVALNSAAFDDPTLGAFLNSIARQGLDFSEEQYRWALEWLNSNREIFVDQEKTLELRQNPEWKSQSSQQRELYTAGAILSMEERKNQYYALPWRRPARGVPSPREEWQQENPDEWRELSLYLNRRKADRLAYPHLLYFNYPRDYKKWYGDQAPDEVVEQAENLSTMYHQALDDLEAYRAGRGGWTYAMEVFIGPPPEDIAEAVEETESSGGGGGGGGSGSQPAPEPTPNATPPPPPEFPE